MYIVTIKVVIQLVELIFVEKIAFENVIVCKKYYDIL